MRKSPPPIWPATIRYGPPAADYVIDILGRLETGIAFDDLVHEPLRTGNVTIRLATPATLYRMKRNTVRPIDRIDTKVLRTTFQLGDGGLADARHEIQGA